MKVRLGWAREVAVLVILSIFLHILIRLLIILVVIANGHKVVLSTCKNMINVLICLHISLGLREEKMLVADSEASIDIPATSNDVLNNIEVCGDQLRFAVSRVLDAMADYIVEGLLQEIPVTGKVRNHMYGLEN